jgi:predicted acylesterase/phospholipase RssA
LGLTLIQRSSGQRPPRNPKVALVLAGGAVSGGAFKVGGLKALDDCLAGRGVNQLDIYVGLSAGAFLATSLAQGIRPDEMVAALEGTSSRLTQLRPIDFYRPNLAEFVARPARFAAQLSGYLPGLALDLMSVLPELPTRVGPSLQRFLDDPSYTQLERLLMKLFDEVSPKREFPSINQLLPSGLFDNTALERWLAANIAAVEGTNSFSELFRETGRRLFITAADLDSAERVVFGPDADHGLTISQAVQASSALPGFFRPVRINGVDYVDGGVQRTANIDVAVDEGADLIICYNPFRPYTSAEGHLADRGMRAVMSQVFRTLLHTRLALGLQTYQHNEQFRGDIVVIEARESDEQFFDLNPLAFWKRADAIRHGFNSVRQTLDEHSSVLGPLFESYGLDFRIPGAADLSDTEADGAAESEDGQARPLRLHSAS